MDIFFDTAMLARIQFAGTAGFHFLFVPLSIGIGLIMAIHETRFYRSKDPKDGAASRLWLKIFTATFAVGVATGITMEFSFGTNWADYSRFVGDIFGAPLAAEALLAFFLESVFLGILLFGRKKISPKFYVVSAWLVWLGSCLSALWILIANSWMQTPAGAELSADGSKAIITDFFAAAFNPSLGPRYFHTVLSLLVVGAFIAMAIAAWYMRKDRHPEFARKNMRIGAVVGAVMVCALLVSAHSSAVVVAEEQPTKFAMMEGMYEDENPPLYIIGWVDEASREVHGIGIPGGSSFLASGSFDTVYPGLSELAATDQYGDLDPDSLPVNFVFQTYHLMVMMFGLIALTLILVFIFTFRKKGKKIQDMKWLQRLVTVSPLFAVVAIQAGWFTAELGRQPWVVYPSASGPEGVVLTTADGVSKAVSAPELWITLGLFTVVYAIIFVAYIRLVTGFVKKGPEVEEADLVLESDHVAKAGE